MKIKEITINPSQRKNEELSSRLAEKIYLIHDILLKKTDDFRIPLEDILSPEDLMPLAEGYKSIINTYLSTGRVQDQGFDVARYILSKLPK